MRSLRVAVIGLGRLGQACAEDLLDADELTLAGIVRRPASLGPLSGRRRRFPVAAHVRDLPETRAALLCMPTEFVLAVARELLQAKIPIVECARLEGQALATHHAAHNEAAHLHRVAAVVGAGWDPGALPLLRSAFEVLIPHGQTEVTRHPGLRCTTRRLPIIFAASRAPSPANFAAKVDRSSATFISNLSATPIRRRSKRRSRRTGCSPVRPPRSLQSSIFRNWKRARARAW